MLINFIYNFTLAIQGPKYNTNVCNPVPKPMEDATPNKTQ